MKCSTPLSSEFSGRMQKGFANFNECVNSEGAQFGMQKGFVNFVTWATEPFLGVQSTPKKTGVESCTHSLKLCVVQFRLRVIIFCLK